ncbi:hypothetical protein MAPG_07633 [Magnaporthiopsis poae ATCC 64411]|uniref:Uncharacterized protein n=1 Tax=Magnaporthiopsis poae (strain ATCC 64411 / 73-15) TaxID=644358 RepID=A0A0C4E568_MAGP6|nr:hypothetical protein MAPG_07633 [Magnaporthiopsis poae ATCC 64411]
MRTRVSNWDARHDAKHPDAIQKQVTPDGRKKKKKEWTHEPWFVPGDGASCDPGSQLPLAGHGLAKHTPSLTWQADAKKKKMCARLDAPAYWLPPPLDRPGELMFQGRRALAGRWDGGFFVWCIPSGCPSIPSRDSRSNRRQCRGHGRGRRCWAPT